VDIGGLSLGLIIGIILSLVVDILKEIIIKEYNIRKEKNLKRTEREEEIEEDLKSHIAIIHTIWDNYANCTIIHPNIKEDIEIEINEIIEFYTNNSKDLKDDLIKKLRKLCIQFLKLTNKKPPSSVEWFEAIKEDGKKLCEKLKKIQNELGY
jgi:hypothetical protein